MSTCVVITEPADGLTPPYAFRGGHSDDKGPPLPAPRDQYELTSILAWKNNEMLSKAMWGEITLPFPNFTGAPLEFGKWVSHFISYFIMHVITYPC